MLAVGKPGSLRFGHGSAQRTRLAVKEAPGSGNTSLHKGNSPSTLEAEWGGSASKLAAYALWAAAARSEHHRRARPRSARAAEAHRRGPGPSLCKLPDKINGFGAPPPAHLDGKHNKAASGIALHQLGIRALFCPPSKAQRGPRRPTLVASGAGCGCQSRHQGSVDGKLSAARQGQAIGNDFDAAVVSGDTGDVQVPYQRVHADGGTSLPTHSGGCTFEWDAAPAQDTRPRASGPVVPQGITHMTTRAPGRAEWQRHA